MLKYINSEDMGRSQLGWLDSYFHFSFAEYRNPENINFGVLRVINDDLIQPDTGFDMHPHANMEIITYIVNGEVTHADSMNNERVLTRGQVQYMSAGKGVVHSEHNFGNDILRLLQIWILPNKKDVKPNYGDYRFEFSERVDKWLPIASSIKNKNSVAPIRIHADINMYSSFISKDNNLDFLIKSKRQAYLVLIEGKVKIDNYELNERDAMEIIEQDININAVEDSHILIIEMKKDSK